ncbi:MAG: hypothetical protein ABW048_04475 [Sphingobium sp.]
MDHSHNSRDAVTLMLHCEDGAPWPLRLSRDCLKFVGRYRRMEGFNVDAMALFRDARPEG